jgi:hypothetical protein
LIFLCALSFPFAPGRETKVALNNFAHRREEKSKGAKPDLGLGSVLIWIPALLCLAYLIVFVATSYRGSSKTKAADIGSVKGSRYVKVFQSGNEDDGIVRVKDIGSLRWGEFIVTLRGGKRDLLVGRWDTGRDNDNASQSMRHWFITKAPKPEISLVQGILAVENTYGASELNRRGFPVVNKADISGQFLARLDVEQFEKSTPYIGPRIPQKLFSSNTQSVLSSGGASLSGLGLSYRSDNRLLVLLDQFLRRTSLAQRSIRLSHGGVSGFSGFIQTAFQGVGLLPHAVRLFFGCPGLLGSRFALLASREVLKQRGYSQTQSREGYNSGQPDHPPVSEASSFPSAFLGGIHFVIGVLSLIGAFVSCFYSVLIFTFSEGRAIFLRSVGLLLLAASLIVIFFITL